MHNTAFNINRCLQPASPSGQVRSAWQTVPIAHLRNIIQTLPLQKARPSKLRCNRVVDLRLRASAAETAALQTGTSALPTTYQRLCARRTGRSFREVVEVEQVPLQLPGEGEALVRVEYAGINGGCELFRVRGEHAFVGNRERGHYLLGAEGCGTIAAVGPGVSNVQAGDAVTFGGGGAFGEYVVVKAAGINRLAPGEHPSPQAAALALSGTVANTALQEVARIQPGEVVLVTAAAGGTGHFAAQVAKLVGCHVIATCGGPAKAARLRALGVDRVVDYKQEDLATVLSREYPAGLDVAYEGVGGDIFVAAMNALKPRGRMLVLGYISQYPHTGASGGTAQVPGLPPIEEIFWGYKALQRGDQVIYGQTLPEDRSSIARRRAEVFDWWRSGQLQAWVDDSGSFQGVSQVADAVEHMLGGNTTGKVVARISTG